MAVSMVSTESTLQPPKGRHKFLAVLVLPFAVLLARTKPIVTETLLKLLRRLMPIPAVVDVESSIAAILWAGKFYPGRVACLEVSIAACLLGALRGNMPVWCVGPKFRPLTHHAWVEARNEEGILVPVAESELSGGWPYQSVMRA